MDAKFTELLKAWLEKPSEERDYTVGALYILQLTGNKILYTNLIAQLPKSKEAIEYQIQKHYNFRVLDLTRQQVDEMKVKAEKIVVEVKTELGNVLPNLENDCAVTQYRIALEAPGGSAG